MERNWAAEKLDNLLPYSTNWTVMMKFAKAPERFEDFFGMYGNDMMQLEKWKYSQHHPNLPKIRLGMSVPNF